MLSESYHWQRPTYRRRRLDSRLRFWVILALILSVAAHGVLWVIFGTFQMKRIDKIVLTEPFRIQRSTLDANLLDEVSDPGNNTQSVANETEGELTEETIAEFTNFTEEDLSDFIVNAEVKLTPAVDQLENVAINPGTAFANEPGSPTDAESEAALTELMQGITERSTPLDPDHPELPVGDVLGGGENVSDPLSDPDNVGGETAPEGYVSLDQVLGMEGGGDPGKPIWVPTDVLFEFNSAELREEARLSLMKLGALIMQRQESEFILEGHTDTIGDEAYNLALSVNRATAIRNWLLEALRLDPQRIKVKGHGKAKPLVLDGDKDAQARNRRVEVTIQPLGTETSF